MLAEPIRSQPRDTAEAAVTAESRDGLGRRHVRRNAPVPAGHRLRDRYGTSPRNGGRLVDDTLRRGNDIVLGGLDHAGGGR